MWGLEGKPWRVWFRALGKRAKVLKPQKRDLRPLPLVLTSCPPHPSLCGRQGDQENCTHVSGINQFQLCACLVGNSPAHACTHHTCRKEQLISGLNCQLEVNLGEGALCTVRSFALSRGLSHLLFPALAEASLPSPPQRPWWG